MRATTTHPDNQLVLEMERNPVAVTWVFFAALWMGFGILMSGPRTLWTFLLSLSVAMLAPWWWVTRYERVLITFSRKEARFFYSRFHPWRESKVVPLQAYTRVYAAPFARNAGWSIHLGGRQGQHLKLGEIASPFEVSMRNADVLALCETIATGLGITNGGDGWRRAP